MNDKVWGLKVLTEWPHLAWYLACAFVATLVVRLVLVTLAAHVDHFREKKLRLASSWPAEDFTAKWKRRAGGGVFWIAGPSTERDSTAYQESPQSPDYWLNTVLGLLELVAFPILMAAGAWVPVGAWITLKTVAQWDVWKKNRTTFNRFLIGNALVLGISVALAKVFMEQHATPLLGMS
jgi:hypothetical protein